MAGMRMPCPLGRTPEPQDLNDGTMFRGLSPLPGSIGSRSRDMRDSLITASAHPIDIVHLAQQLRAASNLIDLQQVAVLLLGSQCFSAGVIVGIGADIINSAVDLFKLCWTFTLADLHDINTSQTSWLRNLVDPTMTVRKAAAAVAGKLFPGELRKATEERDALIRELTEALKNPQELFEGIVESVAKEYKKDWEEFNTHMKAGTLEGRFRAGEIFGRVLAAVIGLITGVGGAVKIGAKLITKCPRLMKLAAKLKGLGKGKKTDAGGRTPDSKVDAPKSEAPGGGKGPPKKEPPNEKTKPPTTREERLNELARDPDHGNAISDASRAEAEAALGLEERGDLPGPVRRPERGDGHSGDFVDGQGRDWDIKAPRSRETLIEEIKARARAAGRPEPQLDPARRIRGEFNTQQVLTEIRGELRVGENVILDTRGLNPADLAELRAAIEQAGLGDRVICYP